MDIRGVMDAINQELTRLGNPLRLLVCEETKRKALATATDCSRVSVVSGKCAAWMCKPDSTGTNCVSTGDVGT